MSDWRKRVDQARFWLVQNQPFYGALAMRLLDKDGSGKIRTAATDSVSVFWNADFVNGLTDREIRFVLAHEALHCAHQHFWRLPLTPVGNMAGDHAINLTLLKLAEDGAAIDMPVGALADPKYAGMSEEEILLDLEQSGEDGEGYSDACGNWTECQGGDGGGEDGKPVDIEALKDVWTRAVIQADIVAKAQRGDTPADMQRIISQATVRHIDWRSEMAEFVKSAVSDRKDWARPARRHATAPTIMPRRKADAVGTVVFVRDTSGSVGDDMLGIYNAAIESAMADAQCNAVIMDCDCSLQAEYRIEPGDTPPSHAKGGGGTSFAPAFKRISKMDEPPAGVVYITDLHGCFPEEPCEHPTLWLVSGGESEVPFGRVVEID